jgi:hypothetical protein
VRIDIVTIFTEYFSALNASLIGKAVQRGDITLGVHDLRGWATDVHRTVDDTPFGGGPGMVMKAEPWGEALDAIVPVLPRGDTAVRDAALAGVRLRPLRGHRRTGRRGRQDPDGRGRGQHRRLRAARRRVGSAGHG